MRILVVDDEPTYKLLLREFLLGEGHEVFDAADGKEALEKFPRVRPEVVISDVYMPVMDGIKLHRTLRAMPGCEHLPFLFVSAFDDEHTRSAVRDPRYEGFLRKGKPVETLVDWIRYLSSPEEQKAKLVPPAGI